MTSASQASDAIRADAPVHGPSPAASRLLRDIKADWKRWTALERITAALVAALSALVPLYLLATLGLTH
jgi:hypothetical protein